MVREFRPNASEQEIDEGCPTFDEYLQYASTIKNKHNYNFSLPRQWCKTDIQRGESFNTVNHWYEEKKCLFFFIFTFNQFQYSTGDQSRCSAIRVKLNMIFTWKLII